MVPTVSTRKSVLPILMQTEMRGVGGGISLAPSPATLHAPQSTPPYWPDHLYVPTTQKTQASQTQDRARWPRLCVHAGARHHANSMPGITGSRLFRVWAPGPREGRSGVLTQRMPLRLPGRSKCTTRGASLQPQALVLSGLSSPATPALSRLRAQEARLPYCATLAAGEAELLARCEHAEAALGRVCEYLRLEELQRWEGNQLLHTERLTLYQAHLETNETLIIAPTGASRLPGPHPQVRGGLCGRLA